MLKMSSDLFNSELILKTELIDTENILNLAEEELRGKIENSYR